MMPFVLPHMHERYFFAADVRFALMVQRPSTWPIAVCCRWARRWPTANSSTAALRPHAGMIPMTVAMGLTPGWSARPGPPSQTPLLLSKPFNNQVSLGRIVVYLALL
jgi:hypothetical protein